MPNIKRLTLYSIVTIVSISSLYCTQVTNAYITLAKALEQENNHQEALRNYQQALVRQPNHPIALMQSGKIFYDEHNYKKAIEALQKRVAQAPPSAAAHLYLGLSYAALKKLNEGSTHFKKALLINPQDIRPYQLLAATYQQHKKFNKAQKYYLKALELDKKSIETHRHIAHCYIGQEQFNQALAWYDKSLMIDENDFKTRFEKANTLTRIGKIEQALTLYQRLIQEKPNAHNIAHNQAHCYKVAGDYAQAIRSYQEILEKKPHNYALKLPLAQCHLALGQMQQGWQLFADYNWQGKKYGNGLYTMHNSAGKRIFIGGELFFDDMILGLRWVRTLKEAGAYIILQTRRELTTLLELQPYIDEVVVPRTKTPSFDFYVPLFNLPSLIGPVTHTDAYIAVDAEADAFWHKKLASNKQRVGICWYADSKNPNPALNKQIDSALFDQLKEYKDLHLYNIQPPGSNQTTQGLSANCMITTFGSGFTRSPENIANYAAMINNLDLVITTDNYVAHLAAGLGVKTWVLLPYNADWRWLREGSTSPWYPTMRLFRQPEPGNWQEVIAQVAKALHDLSS